MCSFVIDSGHPSDQLVGKKKDKPVNLDPKAGADTGKIVNLMAVDANRVCLQLVSTYPSLTKCLQICQMIAGLYFLYSGKLLP